MAYSSRDRTGWNHNGISSQRRVLMAYNKALDGVKKAKEARGILHAVDRMIPHCPPEDQPYAQMVRETAEREIQRLSSVILWGSVAELVVHPDVAELQIPARKLVTRPADADLDDYYRTATPLKLN